MPHGLESEGGSKQCDTTAPPSWGTVMGITEGDLTVPPKEARRYSILSCENLTTQLKKPKGLYISLFCYS